MTAQTGIARLWRVLDLENLSQLREDGACDVIKTRTDAVRSAVVRAKILAVVWSD